MCCDRRLRSPAVNQILRDLAERGSNKTMNSDSHIIPVNKEEIRILVADLGYEETARQTGIKPGTLRQWADMLRLTL